MCTENVEKSDDFLSTLIIDGNEDISVPFNFESVTKENSLLTEAKEDFLCRDFNNFLKGCKWAPDGSCIVTNSEDHKLRLFNIPSQLCDPSMRFEEIPPSMNSVLTMSESELIYDYCWYPLMDSSDPSSCLLLSTSRNNPVHMFDAYTGRIIATFKCYNHLDEVVSAQSLCFSSDGTKLYCGSDRIIRVFNTALPGRNCDVRYTYVDKDGQKGIISCIAVNSTDPNTYAAGSYGKHIGIYDESTRNAITILEGQKGGITHLKFSPDGLTLFSGARKDNEILCWDLRNYGNVLQVMHRDVSTNQRIYFDLSPFGRLMASGNDNGTLTIWDLHSLNSNGKYLEPVKKFESHQDCVNGTSFHPTLPLIATSSGQRHFHEIEENEKEEEMFTSRSSVVDNALRLWWLNDKRCFQSNRETLSN